MSGLVGEMLEHYRLVELIGQGGMATVYRALDTRSLQDVAIKVLSSSAVGDRRFVQRFRREAGFVKNELQHPNIVGVLAYNELRGLVYLVMPFISGETLYGRMTRRRVTDTEAARWIDQVAGALAFAHQKGIIHRDVKPANILIDNEGNARLTDFGLARMIEGSNTLTGSMLMGTPAYVAPEQGRGKRVDGRSDEYSLAVVMYQLAAGRVPFDGGSPMATVLMHIQEPVPRPGRFNPNLSPAVEKVILRGMAKNPDERFPTVAAMNQAYQAAVKGAPQTEADWLQLGGGPETVAVARRVARPSMGDEGPARRSPVIWLAVGAVLALGLVGIVGASALSSMGGARSTQADPATTVPATTESQVALVPTAAGPPATATAVSSSECPSISLVGFQEAGNVVSWTIYNGLPDAILVKDMKFALARDNTLEDVRLGGQSLIDPTSIASGNETPELVALGGEHTQVLPGATLPLTLQYTWPDERPGIRYGVTILFDTGCTLDTAW